MRAAAAASTAADAAAIATPSPAAAAAAPQPPLPRVRRIVKLGGAAVTVKSQVETLRPEVLRHTATALAAAAAAAEEGEGSREKRGAAAGEAGGTVLIHGAGSFGHHPASQYGVARGPLSDSRVRQGFALTRASVTRLNGLVVAALVEAGAPAVGLSPFGIYTTRDREVTQSGWPAVAACLSAGLLPVLHGDCVVDEGDAGCAVLSGDTLVRDLAGALRPDWVVFLTNVAGVYDRPPEEAGARLLTRIAVRPDGSWRVAEVEGTPAPAGGDGGIRMTADAHDVTGGIALKVEEAAAVARLGIPVLIAQAGSAEGAEALARGAGVGRGWRGTRVEPEGPAAGGSREGCSDGGGWGCGDGGEGVEVREIGGQGGLR
ncbi:hypothetical protein HYH03_018052 [Edaphochlamys debaryana]|uniref:Isopentenyl phosphate kinase n=1 Tax=Edaphochlamys debaryana TaxID=47281 RepID=A0A836BPT7_9CHLO|nr:hypothetical protein HYH03_018052 [Edaphochlamys debaryana]|eukprot:KAG2483069.1 hypothetical protein HYH03_018052 [Edaphochlamys debaryana]